MRLAAALLPCMCLSVLCAACSGVRVPGETKLRERNIAIEYYNIAEAYAELGQYEKAVEYYTRALPEKSLSDAAYYKLGRCSALAQDYAAAERVFKALLRKDPANTDISASLAYVYAMQGDVERALSIYEGILQENPDVLEPRKNFIALLVHKDELERAKAQLDILREKFPDDEDIPSFLEELYGADSVPPDEDAAQSLP